MAVSPASLLLQAKEPGGFWIPSDLFDRYAKDLGSRSWFVYCFLARCVTFANYPTLAELASLTGITVKSVESSVKSLFQFGFLNTHDLSSLGYSDAEVKSLTVAGA